MTTVKLTLWTLMTDHHCDGEEVQHFTDIAAFNRAAEAYVIRCGGDLEAHGNDVWDAYSALTEEAGFEDYMKTSEQVIEIPVEALVGLDAVLGARAKSDRAALVKLSRLGKGRNLSCEQYVAEADSIAIEALSLHP